MANLAAPLILSGVSSRGSGLPISLNLSGVRIAGSLASLIFAGIGGEHGVVERAAACRVNDLAVFSAAFGGRHVPAARRGRDQPFARAGAGLLQEAP